MSNADDEAYPPRTAKLTISQPPLACAIHAPQLPSPGPREIRVHFYDELDVTTDLNNDIRTRDERMFCRYHARVIAIRFKHVRNHVGFAIEYFDDGPMACYDGGMLCAD